jgi:hypothetical protein
MIDLTEITPISAEDHKAETPKRSTNVSFWGTRLVIFIFQSHTGAGQ